MSIKLTDRRGLFTQTDHPQNSIYFYHTTPIGSKSSFGLEKSADVLSYISYDGGITYEECQLPVHISNTQNQTTIVRLDLIEDIELKILDPYKCLRKIICSSAPKLTKLDLRGCSSLHTIHLGRNNITNMGYMFYECTSLTDISLLDTSNVIYMDYMFLGCRNLTYVPLLNTSKVTDMRFMFSGCSKLAEVSSFDTHNVKNMSNMFKLCSALQYGPIFNNVGSTTYMDSMFYECINLKSVYFKNIYNVRDMSYMFYNCSSLVEKPFVYDKIPENCDVTNMFYGTLYA